MIALLLKASLISIVLLAFYKTFLEKESFFSANRMYLIGLIFLCFTLPFITLPELVDNQGFISTLVDSPTQEEITEAPNTNASTATKSTSSIEATATTVLTPKPEQSSSLKDIPSTTTTLESPITTTGTESQGRGFTFWLLLIYYFGVGIFLLNLIFQITSIFLKKIKSNDIVEDIDATIVNMTTPTEPCSFFKYIFINPESYDYDTYEQILSHERIHVKQRHSIDLLLSEIAVIILWFNPFIWLFRKEVEKNLEYQTDDLLLNGEAIEKDLYQMNLLKVATYSQPLTVTTNYNQSLLKQRILKMNTKKSISHSYWKYAFIVPIVFVLLLILNKPSMINAQSAFPDTNLPQDHEDANAATELPQASEELSNASEETAAFSTNPAEDIPLANATDMTECDKLEAAARNKDYNLVRKILNSSNLDCLTDKNGNPSTTHELRRGLLKNGANLDLGPNGHIRIYGTQEHIRWGNEEKANAKYPECEELEKAARAGQVAKVRKLLYKLKPGCFTDDDGTINNLVYIKALLRKDAAIKIVEEGEIIIYGIALNIDFSDDEEADDYEGNSGDYPDNYDEDRADEEGSESSEEG